MNWIDTSLLVYGLIAHHPARKLVEQELSRGTWGSSILVLLECYQVLTRDYAVAPADAVAAVERLSRSPIHFAGADLHQVAAAVASRGRHGIQSVDAILLALAKDDKGILVSADRQLTRVAADQGVAVRNLIDAELNEAIVRWEAAELPPKGLGRVLRIVEVWLRKRNRDVAEQFLAATARLTRLPS